MADVKNAFLLMIHLEFTDEATRDRWISLFTDLAQYCLENEPGTLGYDVAIADTNPLKVLVYERYIISSVIGHVPHTATLLGMPARQTTSHTRRAHRTWPSRHRHPAYSLPPRAGRATLSKTLGSSAPSVVTTHLTIE